MSQGLLRAKAEHNQNTPETQINTLNHVEIMEKPTVPKTNIAPKAMRTMLCSDITLVESLPHLVGKLHGPCKALAEIQIGSSHRHLTPVHVPVLNWSSAPPSRDDTAETDQIADGRSWGRGLGRDRSSNDVLVYCRRLPRRTF